MGKRKKEKKKERRWSGPAQKMLWSCVGYASDHMLADRSTQMSCVVGPRPCSFVRLDMARGMETFSGINLGVNSFVSGEEGSLVGFLCSICEMCHHCLAQH